MIYEIRLYSADRRSVWGWRYDTSRTPTLATDPPSDLEVERAEKRLDLFGAVGPFFLEIYRGQEIIFEVDTVDQVSALIFGIEYPELRFPVDEHWSHVAFPDASQT